ncbi:GNAT family N-acetyltransferase [Ferruginibacter sp. SUN106]|uniref:GNAT family N-acetyltransferase n=1 Tax=Ferruginibacter sp. SUN106 TaxID=2978348 RepID=UPI003D365A78
MITIIEYDNKYQPDFYRLNIVWLDKYNLTESHDLEILNDPENTILNNGGFIWLAIAADKIVGTAAIIKESEGVFELAKMSVDEAFQGKGISKLLIEKCIEKAKQIGAKKLELFSNHQLTTALGLYEKYGFQHVTVTNSPFETADVKMEMTL